MRQLTEAPWPGNVRELENVVLSAALLHTGGVITSFDIPEAADRRAPEITPAILERLLVEHEGRLAPVAEELNVTVRTVQRYLVRFGLSRRER